MKGKLCGKCGQDLPLDDFYADKNRFDGHGRTCKSCDRKRQKDSYWANRAVMIERSRRKYAKHGSRWAGDSPNKLAYKKSVYGTEKDLASRQVRNAVQAGKLKKPSACQSCGEYKPLQGHHADYSKPLEVEWLCTTCHGLRHRLDLSAISVGSQPNG